MKPNWISTVFLLSFTLIALIKSHEKRQLSPFMTRAHAIKLKNFQEARKQVSKEDLPYLALWESMLTGKTQGIQKETKQEYVSLGLAHIFTPSGFHLSAALSPITKLTPAFKAKNLIVAGLLLLIFFLIKQGALQRMCMVKLNQKAFGRKAGFIAALFLDVLFGSFQTGPLSFSYSCLFLGIVYSGQTRYVMIGLFFLAQMLICYFNQSEISFLLLFLNPILNVFFGLMLPLLLLLAIPLWGWQLWSGLMLIKALSISVSVASSILQFFPIVELSIVIGLFFICRRKHFAYILLLYSTGLNFSQAKIPGEGKWSFVSSGTLLKTTVTGDIYKDVWSDGKCKRELVQGVWFERCSPLKKSTRKI